MNCETDAEAARAHGQNALEGSHENTSEIKNEQAESGCFCTSSRSRFLNSVTSVCRCAGSVPGGLKNVIFRTV